jgi:hypothetical protein
VDRVEVREGIAFYTVFSVKIARKEKRKGG